MKHAIKDILKIRLVLVAFLLSISTLACSHAKEKSASEVWLIDSKDVSLYRYVGHDEEEVIPIKDNVDAELFMCVSKDEYDILLDKILGAKHD